MTQEFLKIFFFFCRIFPDLNLIVVDGFLLWYGTAPNEPKRKQTNENINDEIFTFNILLFSTYHLCECLKWCTLSI